MSRGSFLDKLLDGVTVEWKALGEVTLPTSNMKWRDATRAYRYIDLTSVSIERKAIIETLEITLDNAPSRAQKLVEKDDVIFATTRPTQQRYCLIGEEYDGEIASSGYCILRARKIDVLPKWILHWIGSAAFKIYAEENQSGSAYPAISDSKVRQFKIPIPCPDNPPKSLAIQAAIVRILDAFTTYTTELTTELTTRRKQYNYYRNQLLNFEDGDVEWKALGELGTFIRGSGIQKSDFTDSGTGCIHYGQIHTHYGTWATKTKSFVDRDFAARLRKAHWGDLVVATTSEDNEAVAKAVAWLGAEDVAVSTDAYIYRHRTNPKYMSYFFQTELFQSQKKPYITGTKVRRISGDNIAKIKIPIPYANNPEKSLAEQARIVAILDQFDALTTSLTEGLPREIALRQKQYAYYRELLLRFPKSDEVEIS